MTEAMQALFDLLDSDGPDVWDSAQMWAQEVIGAVGKVIEDRSAPLLIALYQIVQMAEEGCRPNAVDYGLKVARLRELAWSAIRVDGRDMPGDGETPALPNVMGIL